jgi:hypothetical protein
MHFFRNIDISERPQVHDSLLQFPTAPEILSFRMLPLLTLLCFSTYVKHIRILYMKGIHPTILVLKY